MAFNGYVGNPFQITVAVNNSTSTTGTALSYQWSTLSGPGNASFSSLAVLLPSITVDTAGLYTFRLTATDSQRTSTIDVQVLVQPFYTTTVNFTAYCPLGSGGNSATGIGISSSNISLADATAKASLSAQAAANANLTCATYGPVPNVQINIAELHEAYPSVQSLRLSYLASGTLTSPVSEVTLATVTNLSEQPHPISVIGSNIVNPNNLLLPYGTAAAGSIDTVINSLASVSGAINLILRGAPASGVYSIPIALNLDSAANSGVSINSLSASGSILAAPNAVLTLPNANPGSVKASLTSGTYIGFDTANWMTTASPATALLVYSPVGPLNNPTGLSLVATFHPGPASTPPFAAVNQIDSLLSQSLLSNPLSLIFYSATFDSGSGVYTPIDNSISFSPSGIYSASNVLPSGINSICSILSLAGNDSLGIPSAINGVLFFPNPSITRVVAALTAIS